MRSILLILSAMILIPIGIVTLAIASVEISAKGDIYSVSDVPESELAVVFGAGIKNNAPSDVFADRLLTSRELYEAGKVHKVLISGDGLSSEYYNEALVGKEYLISLGVPEEVITIDPSGLDTAQTCTNLEVFEPNSKAATLITQSWHLPRALWYCNRNSEREVYGVPAQENAYVRERYYQTREYIAQIAAFYGI